jgi:hypothetical protein
MMSATHRWPRRVAEVVVGVERFKLVKQMALSLALSNLDFALHQRTVVVVMV